jgi:hypothetical protein
MIRRERWIGGWSDEEMSDVRDVGAIAEPYMPDELGDSEANQRRC